jgi:hypothetical protein
MLGRAHVSSPAFSPASKSRKVHLCRPAKLILRPPRRASAVLSAPTLPQPPVGPGALNVNNADESVEIGDRARIAAALVRRGRVNGPWQMEVHVRTSERRGIEYAPQGMGRGETTLGRLRSSNASRDNLVRAGHRPAHRVRTGAGAPARGTELQEIWPKNGTSSLRSFKEAVRDMLERPSPAARRPRAGAMPGRRTSPTAFQSLPTLIIHKSWPQPSGLLKKPLASGP